MLVHTKLTNTIKDKYLLKSIPMHKVG